MGPQFEGQCKELLPLLHDNSRNYGPINEVQIDGEKKVEVNRAVTVVLYQSRDSNHNVYPM